ncbi:hypothetical protein PENSPDRAFT_750173 [Peniophora sp. CONT]|nr:hypothetical protein PENSPDRAFT_750173 [Peniophora sp. CONT]
MLSQTAFGLYCLPRVLMRRAQDVHATHRSVLASCSLARLVAGCPAIMSSRADSMSPPPYSFEVSSFPPPPPHEGEISRNWDFQAKFEAAEEPVRLAVLDTITAWTAPPKPDVWDWIERNEVQDAYDNAPVDLKRALDFITDCGYPTYLSDDKDRRTHQYFWRLASAGIEDPGVDTLPILSASAFVADFDYAHEEVKRAVLSTCAIWKYNVQDEYRMPAPHEMLEIYQQSPKKLKTWLNWVLQIGCEASIQSTETLRSFQKFLKRHLDAKIAIRNEVQPII